MIVISLTYAAQSGLRLSVFQDGNITPDRNQSKEIIGLKPGSKVAFRNGLANLVVSMCAPDESQIARDILSYLYTHTAAHDTLEGIVEWWILEQKIERQTKQVQKVLDELVAKGLISSHTASDSKTHYRINKRKVKEIGDVLERENE